MMLFRPYNEEMADNKHYFIILVLAKTILYLVSCVV